MSITCESIKPSLGSFSLVRHCDVVKDGSLRIATPFSYPDGSLIDVFIEEKPDLLTAFKISDKGHTSAYLLNLQIKHWATQRRKLLVSDICRALDVQQNEGVFSVSIDHSDIKSLPSHLVRLAQACIRVSDLAFTQRLRTEGVFHEDVEEFISSTELVYETRVEVPGKFNKPVEFDFLVHGRMVNSLIQTVSAPSGPAHNISNEVFTRWYDIDSLRSHYQCLTVYDSTRDYVVRPEDMKRLSELSTVIAYPAEEERLKETLLA